jgi:hypothetical protein
MRSLRLSLVLALALTPALFSACTMTDGGDDVLLRVNISSNSVATAEVAARGPIGQFDDALRPQMDGDVGIIWTDSTGDTLDEGWVARTDGSNEIEVLVPAPDTSRAILTITVQTDSGPLVVSRQLDL